MRCRKCGYENKEGVAVCNNCAALLAGADLRGPAREAGPVERTAPELEFRQASLRSICGDARLHLLFDSLSDDMARSGFHQFLDYSVPQFGAGNFTRGCYNGDIPAYGLVVFRGGNGRGEVHIEFVTPFDNGYTLTTTTASAQFASLSRPAEHMVLARAGASAEQLLSLHQSRMTSLREAGANPLPCAPDDYRGHVRRHYEESLTHAARGRSGEQFTGDGAGCATILAALAGVGLAALLLFGGW